MSGNLDLVRSIYADWERGDFSAEEWVDVDIEYRIVGLREMLPQNWRGLAGARVGARGVLEVMELRQIAAEEYRELDGGEVLVLDRRVGRLKRSGMQFGTGTSVRDAGFGAHVFHVRDGKVRKLVAYFDRDRAIADLGLEA
jgi:ketosteroid isomerase-like protein